MYRNIKDLPSGIRNNLPEKAQKIYLNNYNKELISNNSDHRKAHLYAWAKVKQEFQLTNNFWSEKNRP